MSEAARDTDVLICGAGPTGLVLALRLVRAGVRFRIVDAAAEPGTRSRALVVHARTLEYYRQMGLDAALLEEGTRFGAVNLWVRGRHRRRVAFAEPGKGLSPYPYMVVVPQDRHERFLIDRLAERGVHVERSTELVDVAQADDAVTARLRGPDGAERSCRAAYLAGCDGARSRAREVVGAGFPGGTYSHLFYVADVEGTGPVMNGELHVALDDHEFLGVFPLLGGTTARLIGTVGTDDAPAGQLRWEDVSKVVLRRLGIGVAGVNWFSTYHVHHRVATRFRAGRVFLLGDAAHIHSPVGGQGMNTGIGDAVNLSWKLADVLHGTADARLLDSYEPERIAFARRLVGTTDRAFQIVTSPGRLARFVRTRLVPLVAPQLVRPRAMQRFMFRTVSQTAIHYRGGPLAAGTAGQVRGGDRLPWVDDLGPPAGDNFAGLDGRGWQVHAYGEPPAWLPGDCHGVGVVLRSFPWTPAASRAGLARGAAYLVRPDGYVAWADGAPAPGALAAQARRFGVLARGAAVEAVP